MSGSLGTGFPMAGGVDTSSYPKAGAIQPPDLLGMYAKYATTQNAMNQNAQFQQQFAAKQAMGPILQSAVGPDGQLDYNKAFVGMAANPATAFMAGDFLKQATDNKKTQTETAGMALDQQIKKTSAMGDAMVPLLAKGNNVTSQDVIGQLSTLYGAGIINDSEAHNYMMGLPEGGQALADALKQHATMLNSGADRMNAVYGAIQPPVNAGGQQVLTTRSPLTGVQVQGTLTNTPSPDQLNALTPAKNAQGQEIQVPRAQVAPMFTGMGAQVPGTGAAPGVNGGPVGLGATPQGGAVMTPPAAISAYNEGHGPLVEQEQSINEGAKGALLANAQLDQQLADVQKIGPGGLGGGKEVMTRLANLAQTLTGNTQLGDAIQGGGPGAVQAAQEIQKYAVRSAANAATQSLNTSRITGGEFSKFEGEGNPNITTNPDAFRALTNFSKAVNQVQLDEQAGWNQYKKTPEFLSEPQGFQNKWNTYLQRSGRIKALTQAYDQAQKAWTTGKVAAAPAGGTP